MAIENILNSNPNLIVISTPNLTAPFSTLWFFFADVSNYKHHTWQNCETHSNFYRNLHIWYHEILTNLIIFGLHLLFLEFKIIRIHVRGRVFGTRWSKFLFIWWVRPQTRLNNMNIIFPLILFYYLNQLWSNLTLLKNCLKCN